MNKLTVELDRLFGGAPEGQTRAVCLTFKRLADIGEAGHWEQLCTVANALQSKLGWPAPAVSIAGTGAYCLWISLAAPVALAQARELRELLRTAYCPEQKMAADAASMHTALPPLLHQASGTWAAFINPGMGASFVGGAGLEVLPPEAGQVGLLEKIESVSAAQLEQALQQLRQAVPRLPPAAPSATAQPDGLLLKDATLEDIVNFLHSRNIEPTFRFLK